MTTKIPIEPYLAEYLQGKFNDYQKGAIRLPDELDLYHLIYDLLRKRPVNCTRDIGNLEIYLPERRAGKRPETYNYIGEPGRKLIERRISSMFNSELHEYMESAKHDHGVDYKEAAYRFLRAYGIESISADGLVKNFYRWRYKLKKYKKASKF